MAGEDRVLANGARHIDFQTDPSRYRHWKLEVDGDIATLTMDVDENGGLFEGYQLKLNSYDLGVDIELADAVQRLRFEHPGVKVALLRSDNVVSETAKANGLTLEGLGITPDSLGAIAPQYLWRFRAAGQFQRKSA